MKELPSRDKRAYSFKITWLVISVVASGYFSWWLFPDILAARSEAVVDVWFLVEQPPSSGQLRYYPNLPTYRSKYLKYLKDATFLYFDAGQTLPVSQRVNCDPQSNWYKIDPRVFRCNNVRNCETVTYRLSAQERYKYLSNIVAREGRTISVADATAMSFSDPITWGDRASLPLFFVILFLALKLGSALGEFWFKSYDR